MNKRIKEVLDEMAFLIEDVKSVNGLAVVELSPDGQTALTPDDMKGLKIGRHFTPDGVRGLAFSSTKKIYLFSEMVIHSDALKKLLPSFPRKLKDSFSMGLIFPFIAAFMPNGKLEFIGDLFSPENFDPAELKKRLGAGDAKQLAEKLGEKWGWMSFVFPEIRKAFIDQITS
jgi:hypothetical protein